MWIIQSNAVADEQQDSIQKIQNRFRSGVVAQLISINISIGFSQSLSWVSAGGDTRQNTKYQPIADLLRILQNRLYLGYLHTTRF